MGSAGCQASCEGFAKSNSFNPLKEGFVDIQGHQSSLLLHQGLGHLERRSWEPKTESSVSEDMWCHLIPDSLSLPRGWLAEPGPVPAPQRLPAWQGVRTENQGAGEGDRVVAGWRDYGQLQEPGGSSTQAQGACPPTQCSFLHCPATSPIPGPLVPGPQAPCPRGLCLAAGSLLHLPHSWGWGRGTMTKAPRPFQAHGFLQNTQGKVGWEATLDSRSPVNHGLT